jgi:hypothetical protein
MTSEGENVKRQDRATDEATETPVRPAPNLPADHNAGNLTIAKPGTFDLDKFKSKRAATIANVEALPARLPHYKISNARDFVRLHPDTQNYWSAELCFVLVPITGHRNDLLHLIEEDLAMGYLPSAQIRRFRLALASKPNDVFFLAHVPSQNLENGYNASNYDGCELAKTFWVKLASRREEGVEAYKIEYARDPDAFPEPRWPRQSLNELIVTTFADCMIDREDHPALARLIGKKIT